MTRPFVESGISGPGQVRFTEGAKESGRVMALTGTVQIYRSGGGTTGGGAPTGGRTAIEPSARGRIDRLGDAISSEAAAQINETSTHIVTADRSLPEPRSDDHLFIDGQMWSVTAIWERTDDLVHRIEVERFVK